MVNHELLTVHGLTKRYPGAAGTFVLAPFDLQLHAGQTIGIVGQSGSGKTTIARMLMGMTPASGGTITFDGQPLLFQRSKEQRRRLQYIFQNPYSSLDPRLTVRRLIAEPLQFYFGLSGQALDQKIHSLLSAVELDESLLVKKPRSLSGGQCQRIGIIRALAAQPDVLVCDEPTSALDAFNQIQVLHLLKRLQQQSNIGLIFISHALEVVYQLADDVYVFHRGQLVETGTRDQVYTHPQAAYTRQLLEAVPSRGI